MRKLMLAFVLAIVSGLAAASPVRAQESSAYTEVVCDTGSYGQPINCRATAEATASAPQTQRQYIRRADGTLVEVHRVINTGLDTTGVLSVAGLLVSGSMAAFTKIKSWR